MGLAPVQKLSFFLGLKRINFKISFLVSVEIIREK